MKNILMVIVFSLLIVHGNLSVATATPVYFFEYSGTVRSVGGTVTDGSLLAFAVNDKVAGAFLFNPAGLTPPPGATTFFYPNSIESFTFGSYSAIGNQASYSYFSLSSLNGGLVNAYKQVGTDSIYDNFSFVLSSDDGTSPFPDVLFDLTTLSLNDFAMFSSLPNSNFSLQRVDISSNPLRFTEVTANFDSLNVSVLADPNPIPNPAPCCCSAPA